jgi:hypothetical protein
MEESIEEMVHGQPDRGCCGKNLPVERVVVLEAFPEERSDKLLNSNTTGGL